VNATAEQMWADVQAGITTHVTNLLNFAKDVSKFLSDYVVMIYVVNTATSVCTSLSFL
jgi:hypothetical protein